MSAWCEAGSTPNALAVLSFGLGTQSSCIAAKAAIGELPRLDAAIFADTGSETEETYAWAERMKSMLKDAGIPFIRCSQGDLLEDHLTATKRKLKWFATILARIKFGTGYSAGIQPAGVVH